MEKEAQKEIPSNEQVIVKGTNFCVKFDRPCPEYSSFGTESFKAIDKSTGKEYIALLSSNQSIPRFSYMPSMRSMRIPNMLSFYNYGVVQSPIDQQNYMACIFDVPHGHKVMDKDNGGFKPDLLDGIPSKALVHQIIEPFLKILESLRNAGVSHAAINLNNIYVLNSGNDIRLQLGECLTSSHSYTQHALFEPINRSLAQRTARGPSSEKNDLYSLGICIALLLRGSNSFESMSEKEIIKYKIETGSYNIMTRGASFSSNMSEFLRSVLNDDYSSRWSLDDTFKWLEGARTTIRAPQISYKASTPYIFMDEKYNHVGTLVNAFVENPSSAIQILKGSKFRDWLHHNISDKEAIANFDKNFGTDKNPTEAYNKYYDLMLTHACIALCPDTPIRYKNLSLMPRGIGIGFAHAIMHGDDIKPYVDILQKQIASYWFDMQYIQLSDYTVLNKNIEKGKNFLKQKMVGRGVERTLYSLCWEVPCLSPTIKSFYVRNAVDLLNAFEILARDGNIPSLNNFFDRHIVAFLMEREPKIIEPNLSMINSTERDYKIIGILRIFTIIQEKHGGDKAPYLFKWIVSNIEPALSRIHNRKLRRKISKEINNLSGETRLYVLMGLIDNINVVREDTKGFMIAQAEYLSLNMEKMVLMRKLEHRGTLGVSAGRQVAMVTSVVLSMLCIAIILYGYI